MKYNSVQEWLPFKEVLENGIIKLKNNSYIKIIKINPINFNLKSELEKEAILNSYKTFLKTINFNFQILIQSNKEDFSNHISNINNQKTNEEKNINILADKYIEYIQNLNNSKKSSIKNFFIIIKNNNKNGYEINNENYIIEDLNEKFFKIKDCLSRCGNIVTDISEKKIIINILYSFLNTRKFLNK